MSILVFILTFLSALFANARLQYATDNFIIIWWSDLLFPHFEDNTLITCAHSTCISSKTKKKNINTSKIVTFIFYGTDFNPEYLPLPRKPNHVWALLHEESPMNNFIFSHSLGIKLFNYTSTFSRHSDFPLTTQFFPSVEYLTERQPIPMLKKNKLRKLGFAPILYIQSHCDVPSDRDRYVEELSKHIAIDSYGKCLTNKGISSELNSTDTHDSDLFLDFIAQYKFHIAFENAICEDYFTEKLTRAFHVGSVPIYRGSPTIKDWVPSAHSIIITDDFDTPEKLAAYILKLDEDDTLYTKYLDFKKNGISNDMLKTTLDHRPWGINDENKIDFFQAYECFICDRVSEIRTGNVSNKMANKKHMNCPQPRVSVGDDINMPLKDKWKQGHWPESYWYGFDEAKAVHKMIEKKENKSTNFMKYLMDLKYDH